jgi:hypothetical protein
MTRMKRNDDWGFPRWRDYGAEKEAVKVRLCDYTDCGKPGDFKAPKAPNSNEYWQFCADHVADYNKNWDYFAGLSPEEAYQRAREEARDTAYARSSQWQWAQDGEDGVGSADNGSFGVLGLPFGATEAEVKSAYRSLAKQYHPDRNPNDKDAAAKFHAISAAYERLQDFFLRTNGKTSKRK